jgi:hypothetical protein
MIKHQTSAHPGYSVGGLSPVFVTSFSTVTVVVPPGVETFTSLEVDDFSEHPTAPSESKLSTKTEAKNCFIFLLFQLNIFDPAASTRSQPDSPQNSDLFSSRP